MPMALWRAFFLGAGSRPDHKNPCAESGKLYHGTRVHKSGMTKMCHGFCVLHRRIFSLRCCWRSIQDNGKAICRACRGAHTTGNAIKLRQRKTGAYVLIPVSDELKDVLDATPRKSPIMLTNSEASRGARAASKARGASNEGRNSWAYFHDLRGTAVVTLARAGCKEVEIYSITGHKPGDVQAILTAHYLPRDAEVAGNAIAKLINYRERADRKENKILPTALPTALKSANGKTEKA